MSVLLTHIHPTNKDEFEMALAYLLDQKHRIKPHSVPFYKTQEFPSNNKYNRIRFSVNAPHPFLLASPSNLTQTAQFLLYKNPLFKSLSKLCPENIEKRKKKIRFNQT